jgi:hypothetical protein
MALDRNQIKLPVLPRETVQVDSLGGEVIVRGLLLSERMRNDRLNEFARQPLDGETEDDARARAGSLVVPRVLAQTVIDADGQPLMNATEWDQFGSVNRSDVFHLFNTAMRLSGQDQAAIEKNSEPSRTEDSPSS